MSASLERMGDLARHIAQLARLRYPDTVVPDRCGRLQEIRREDLLIAQKLTELLETRDLDVARESKANAHSTTCT